MSTNDTPSNRDEIPAPRTAAVGRAIGKLAFDLKDKTLNLMEFAVAAQSELDKLGEFERELIRLSAEREKENVPTWKEIANDRAKQLVEYERAINSLSYTLAERDKVIVDACNQADEAERKHKVTIAKVEALRVELSERDKELAEVKAELSEYKRREQSQFESEQEGDMGK